VAAVRAARPGVPTPQLLKLLNCSEMRSPRSHCFVGQRRPFLPPLGIRSTIVFPFVDSPPTFDQLKKRDESREGAAAILALNGSVLRIDDRSMMLARPLRIADKSRALDLGAELRERNRSVGAIGREGHIKSSPVQSHHSRRARAQAPMIFRASPVSTAASSSSAFLRKSSALG
jgi:hypothetical protein